MFKVIVFALWSFTIMTAAPAQSADLENTLYMDLEHGRVTIQMLPDIAPKHVDRIWRSI